MSRSLIIGIYYAVLILCIGLSSYFSFRGFLPTLGNSVVTLLFVAIIALGLFAAGTLIQIARDKKSVKEQVLALIMFSVFACFSTSSNFTYLYSEQRKETERENAIHEEEKKFDEQISKLEHATDEALKKYPSYKQDLKQYYDDKVQQYDESVKTAVKKVDKFIRFRNDVNLLKEEFKKLHSQVNDSRRPGCGPRCMDHVNRIQDIVSVTEYNVPSERDAFNKFHNEEFQPDVWIQYCSTRGSLVKLYYFVNGESPQSDHCDVEVDNIQTDTSIDETNKDDTSSVDGIEFYLVKLNQKLDAINTLISDASLGNIGVDVPKIPESFETASDSFNTSGPEIMSGLLVKFKEAKKTWKSSNNCEKQKIIEDPRNCLVLMNNALHNVKTSYDTEFGDSAETVDIASINTERGQVGSIKDTLYSGFIERPHLPSTIFSFLVGVMIDVLPLIFCFVAFHGYHRPQKEPDDPFGVIS